MAQKPRNKGKRFGIWIRVSTDMQAQGDSPLHHEKRARAFAEAKDWKVATVYDLSGVSGKSVIDHPEAKRMMADVKSGDIDGIIFTKLARLARNTRELLDFADYFKAHNTALVSLDESFDTSTPSGMLFYTVLSALTQWEREEISARAKASVPIRAKLGKNTGGQASFGYQWKDGKLIPHPEEAPIRRHLYELFAEHKRLRTVARMMNEQGYRTRKCAAFSDTTVKRLLADPTAKGEHRANYTTTSDRTTSWDVKPESEWVIREVEPIISVELWDACNQELAERAKAYKRPARRSPHLFTGYMFCCCGGKMYVPSNSRKYVCAECKDKISIDDIEGIYHDQLTQFFLSGDEQQRFAEKADEDIRDKEMLLKTLHSEKEKTEREMEKVYQLYLKDKISPDGFGRRNRPLEERLAQIEDELPRLEGQLDNLKSDVMNRDVMMSEGKELFDDWNSFSTDKKKLIIDSITDHITVCDDAVTLHFKDFNPSPIPTKNQSSHPSESNDNLATNPHGFIAATNWTRAG